MRTISYGKAILIALDQFANTLLGGWPDETLSSRAWRWEASGKRRWPRRLIDRLALLFGDVDHCFESWRSEVVGAQLPPSVRKARNE